MTFDKKKPVLFSGIQPSGNLTIGNYIGALRNWVALQDRYDSLFVLVDLHAITVRQNPEELLRRSYEFLRLYLACGIDPEKSTIFIQSHVAGHARLTWILNCFTYMGELNRMKQFKEKYSRHSANVNAGLFDYPVLMATDILLYETDLVPVGEDQKQHLELTRDVAARFNNLYGEIFTVPESYIPEFGARIMSLRDPASKMSKSDENPNNYIALLDPPDVVRLKLMSAVTDSGREIKVDKGKPGISNLLSIYSAVSGKPIDLIERDYGGSGYGRFKEDLAEIDVDFLRPVQERYTELTTDQSYLDKILHEGAARANRRSQKILHSVHEAIGFIPQESR
jgi:tryptophanyl-tRNA synthetase